MDSTTVPRERTHFTLSRQQKAFILIAFAITAVFITLTVASAATHQHDFWWSPLNYQGCATQGQAEIDHFHTTQPWPYAVVAYHDDWWDYNCVDMVGVKARISYYGTETSGWYIGDWWAMAQVTWSTCDSCIYWGDAVYTKKVNGAWTFEYQYSAMLWP